ncbi:L,D-transpeptidase family protein [Labrys okinawensis]|uniref:L,D-transpeptidase family protein n=1 Tax=Labrys okinawensis TaxID=346911 RepID=UPI0039BC4203
MKRQIRLLRVQASPLCHTKGRLTIAGVTFPCVLGRSGLVTAKREGDGGTPRGALPLRGLLQRRDRGPRIPSALPFHAIRPEDAWCDDVADRRYNKPIKRPLDQTSEERLTRADRLYDVIIPLGWNDGPIVKGRGSAIFWHLSRENGSPTAGCVAVTPDVFRKVLPRLSRHAVMVIG